MSYIQKSAAWTLYGRAQMSVVVSQLILSLDTSDPKRDGHYLASEAVAIAMSNVAKNLYETGWDKKCDKVMELARYERIL